MHCFVSADEDGFHAKVSYEGTPSYGKKPNQDCHSQSF